MTSEDRAITHGHPDYYAMFTDDGNRAVAAMVTDLRNELEAGRTGTPEELNRALEERVESLVQAGHDEVLDTDVRERVLGALAEPMRAAAIDPGRVDFP